MHGVDYASSGIIERLDARFLRLATRHGDFDNPRDLDGRLTGSCRISVISPRRANARHPRCAGADKLFDYARQKRTVQMIISQASLR